MPANQSLWQILREPVLAETRANLARSWSRVPEQLRTPHQMLGRGGNGCGATIGALPRCDFACVGCYLGEEANTIPPLSVEAVKEQMRRLRPSLGNAGNLQLTDGELTLRPEAELIELLRYAQSLRLIPMLMTHGDTFRRRPGLLERLVVDGGLVEVSIHIDTTQRGRLGDAYRHARTEEELMPLRVEFADMIRDVSRRTGRPLRAATTMTVTADNIAGVPAVVRWLARNADAFRLISFQPIAQVGRTLDGLGGGASVEVLWEKIAEGFDGPGASPGRLERGLMWLGHPGCNRYLAGVVSRQENETPRFHPMRTDGDPMDQCAVDGFLLRFGGVSFRLDAPIEKLTRIAALVLREPAFLLGTAGAYLRTWLGRFDGLHPWRFAWRLLTGRARVNGLVIVSHHFMSREEALSPVGQERLGLCVFNVPVGDQLVPMCEVNALGVREKFYEELRTKTPRTRSLPVAASMPERHPVRARPDV